MNIAICDDNAQYIRTIEDYIGKLNNKGLEYDIYYSGEKLLASLKNDTGYDAILLDMEMSGLDGIKTADRIRLTDKHVIIVFVTSHTKYMQESFRCAPFRFLIKPLKFEDFKKVCEEIRAKLDDEPETFVFFENKKRTRVFASEIVFLECSAHSIFVHMRDGIVHKIRKSMDELLNAVPKSTFVRVHRGFVVNLFYIYKISDTSVTMHCYDKTIPIGRTYAKNLEDAFLNFKERKYLI